MAAVNISNLVPERFYKAVLNGYPTRVGKFVEHLKENNKIKFARFNTIQGEWSPHGQLHFTDNWTFYPVPPPAGGRRRSNRRSKRRSTHKRRR
jgi:hypothetical protein